MSGVGLEENQEHQAGVEYAVGSSSYPLGFLCVHDFKVASTLDVGRTLQRLSGADVSLVELECSLPACR